MEEQDHAEFDEAIEALKSENCSKSPPTGAIGLPSLARGGTVLGKFRKAMKASVCRTLGRFARARFSFLPKTSGRSFGRCCAGCGPARQVARPLRREGPSLSARSSKSSNEKDRDSPGNWSAGRAVDRLPRRARGDGTDRRAMLPPRTLPRGARSSSRWSSIPGQQQARA